MLDDERERAVCGRQLLDCGQWAECVVHSVSCRRVLLVGLQLVERKRVVRCGQLLDCRQWYKRNLHALSRRTILPFWLQQQRGQRSV